MGYAVPNQIGRGIHMRLHARAFTISDGDKSIAFVSLDGGMGSDVLTKNVLTNVAEQLGDDSIYTYDNVGISGTHTHSGPAGFLQYILYQFTSLGYVQETMDAFVTGISNAIVEAHNNMQENVDITYSTGNQLFESNINRSPTSYLLNPADERSQYPDGDTDKNMLLLKFATPDADIAMLNWYAVHGTSLNNTNKLISGDNKGLASYFFEKEMNGAAALPGTGKFVAAFASTNLGDVSPNTAGAKCIDTGLPCDTEKSTCGGKNEMCIAFGPGTNGDMFESVKIIAENQYKHAKDLYASAKSPIAGPVDYRHTFLNMNNLPVTLEDGSTSTTCTAALGYAFAAGTTDGPGMFDFTQGTNSSSPFWNIVSGFLSKPTDEEKACQSPKPILLNTGDCEKPYAWDPASIPISIQRVGNLFILNVPGELTTMAGRRMRAQITKVLEEGGVEDPIVTIAGLSNTYTHYITTFEEYQAQRYEAASTLYGPHTLTAYMQEMTRIAKDMLEGRESTSSEAPEDLTASQIEFVPPVIEDFVGIGNHFGDVEEDAAEQYTGTDVIRVSFKASNPRNDQRLGGTFGRVEKKGDDGEYTVVFNDGDWCTKFEWKGGVGHFGKSTATIEWDVKESWGGAESGVYRICYGGEAKEITGMKKFEGCSRDFTVAA